LSDGGPTRQWTQSSHRSIALKQPNGVGRLRLSVTDTGPGISPDRLGQVFEPFVTTKPNGMGLGLAVCRTIVTAHGGELSADHADGGGALFLIDLPAVEADVVSAA
jgi:two-component system sensor kinase FixL